MNKSITYVFDENNVDEKTRKRLEHAGERSKNRVKVERLTDTGPVLCTDCPYCRKPIPNTTKGFACVRCCVIIK